MRQRYDEGWREILRLRAEQASLRVSFLALKLSLALERYNANQPRVPAGGPEGGRWTDGESVQARLDRLKPRADWASGRPPRRGPPPVVIGARAYEVSPAQAVRYHEAARRADDATARVRCVDPGWRPEASLTPPGVEGAIQRNEAVLRQAEARPAELSPPVPRPRPLGKVLGRAQGGLIGERFRGADENVRTIAASSARCSRTASCLLGSPAMAEGATASRGPT